MRTWIDKIANTGLTEGDSLSLKKRIRLTNQISASFILSMFAVVVVLGAAGIYIVSVVLSVCISILLAGFGFAAFRWFNTARMILIAEVNLGVMFIQWMLGPEYVAYIFLIVCLPLPFLVFNRERLLIAASIFISTVSIILAINISPEVFRVDFPALVQSVLFFLNVFCSGLTTVLFILYFFNENRAAENKLNEKLETLKKSQSRLLQTNKELDELNYRIAHDLKRPARGIQMLATMIKEDLEEVPTAIPDQINEQLNMLETRTQMLENLIKDILDYGRAGTEREQTEIDIPQLVKGVLDFLAVPKTIEVEVQEDMPTVVASKIEIWQVYQNLISNAVKYGTTANPTIEIGCFEEGEQNVYFVRDNGNGIAPRFHDKIFRMFEVLGHSQTEESTGVGLAIVKKIIENKGGKIWLVSELGQGADFRFTFPSKS